jgi:uroporphyrinogen decarboxylase
MNSRERFLGACACEPLERPPLWMMRQAGRYLPEYRELKAKHGFLTMVRTPELAAEVSMQPMRRFAFDAAILFCDILVIPEALGQGYTFRDEGGIAMEHRLEDRSMVEALAPESAVPERLSYVADALRLLKRELAGTKALLGFGGSPWTLATYMVEGGSSDDFARVKGLFYSDRPTFDLLLGKLTASLIAYFKMQIAAGADAIQIFDSWGGVVAGNDYEAASLRWIRAIVEAMPEGFPIIIFGKGTGNHLIDQAFTGAKVLSSTPRATSPARAQPSRECRRPGQPRPRDPQHLLRGRPQGDRAPPRVREGERRPHLQPRPRDPPAGQDRVRRGHGRRSHHVEVTLP